MPDIGMIEQTFSPIAKKYGLRRAYLFGSYAKGLANEDSDIDLLVEKGRPLSLLMLSGLLQDAKEAFGLSVDLVTTTGLDDDFKRDVEDTKVLIYESAWDTIIKDIPALESEVSRLIS